MPETKLDKAGKFILSEEGEVLLNFGSRKGYPAKDNKGFLHWMLKQSFEEDTMKIANDIFWDGEIKK